MAVVVWHHENIRHGGLDRTSKLLRGVRKVDRGAERKDSNARKVFETEVFARQFIFGDMFGRGGCGSGVGHRCPSVGKVRRHRHCPVIGHSQAAQKLGWRSNIHQRRNHLPLAADARDLGDDSSSAAVRGLEELAP